MRAWKRWARARHAWMGWCVMTLTQEDGELDKSPVATDFALVGRKKESKQSNWEVAQASAGAPSLSVQSHTNK